MRDKSSGAHLCPSGEDGRCSSGRHAGLLQMWCWLFARCRIGLWPRRVAPLPWPLWWHVAARRPFSSSFSPCAPPFCASFFPCDASPFSSFCASAPSPPSTTCTYLFAFIFISISILFFHKRKSNQQKIQWTRPATALADNSCPTAFTPRFMRL